MIGLLLYLWLLLPAAVLYGSMRRIIGHSNGPLR